MRKYSRFKCATKYSFGHLTNVEGYQNLQHAVEWVCSSVWECAGVGVSTTEIAFRVFGKPFRTPAMHEHFRFTLILAKYVNKPA